MTKSRGIALLLVILIGIVGFIGWRTGAGDDAASMGPGAASPAVAATEVPGDDGGSAPVTELVQTEGSEREAVAPVAEPPAALDGPSCRVFGRIEDELGAPLAGVSLSLRSAGEGWGAGVEEDRFTGESDASGAFEFVVPVPTSSWIFLNVEPSRFHTLADRDFGKAGGRNEDPLVEGDNDLGTFTLLRAGAIAGIVRSADGRAFEKGRVRLDGSFPGGRSLGGAIEPTGRYEIAHVPPGTYNIEALATGYLTAGLPSIDVQAGAVSDGHDILLEVAPSVRGRVVDEAGEPLAKVRVWGWPLSSGQGAGARSDERGEFVVYLPQDEPYRFSAKLPGFAIWGEEDGGRGELIEPGTTDVEVVMVRELRTTFAVVRAVDGAPVERFGLEVVLRPSGGWSSSGDRSDVALQDAPGGELTLPADPEKHDLKVQAPGFAPQVLQVAHDEGDEGGDARQTIRLEPAGVLRGRVLFEGAPVPGAIVRVERDWFMKDGQPRLAEFDPFDERVTYDLGKFTGRLRILSAGDDGVFEVGELATGTYRLELSADVGSPFVREELHVTAGETLDLGDLPLVAGGVVRGQVVLAGGVSPAGLEVVLDSSWDGQVIATDGDGAFEFKGVAPGAHTLKVEHKAGVLLGMDPVPITVAGGETRDVVLDLRSWQTGRVRLRVTEDGVPLAGVTAARVTKKGRVNSTDRLTNAAGECVIEWKFDELVRVLVLSEEGFLLGSSDPVEAHAGAEVVADIEVRSGELTLEYPAGFVVPELGQYSLELESELLEGLDFFPYEGSTNSEQRGPYGHPWDSTSVVLGRVAAGTYDVRVRVTVYTQGAEPKWKTASHQRLEATAEVPAGGSTTCKLKLVEEQEF